MYAADVCRLYSIRKGSEPRFNHSREFDFTCLFFLRRIFPVASQTKQDTMTCQETRLMLSR